MLDTNESIRPITCSLTFEKLTPFTLDEYTNLSQQVSSLLVPLAVEPFPSSSEFNASIKTLVLNFDCNKKALELLHHFLPYSE